MRSSSLLSCSDFDFTYLGLLYGVVELYLNEKSPLGPRYYALVRIQLSSYELRYEKLLKKIRC